MGKNKSKEVNKKKQVKAFWLLLATLVNFVYVVYMAVDAIIQYFSIRPNKLALFLLVITISMTIFGYIDTERIKKKTFTRG